MNRRCSSCGGQQDLTLVTSGDYSADGDPPAGRILLYCRPCREERDGSWFLSIIPLQLVDEDLFVDLYRKGLTGSDPEIAADIVFGQPRPDLADHAVEASLEGDWPYLRGYHIPPTGDQ